MVEIRSSISELIRTQQETKMMAKINDDYILRTIEPPFIPEKKSKPNRKLICILTTIFGGMLGILWVSIRHYALDTGKQESGS